MADEARLTAAMEQLGAALKRATPEERTFLEELRTQIDAAVAADGSLDKRGEFCLSIVFAGDAITTPVLKAAAKEYVDALNAP